LNAQKIIENPEFGIGTDAVFITKIVLTDTETALTFKLNLEPGRTFGIASKSYIQVVGQSDSLFMTRKDAPEPVNGWITVPEGGLSYTLYFPPIDPKTEKIDFGEPTAQPWMIYDIVISKPPYSSVIPEELSGNWFSTETGKWGYSFFEKKAIADEQVWEYASVKKQEQLWKITLKANEKEKVLFAKTAPNGCQVGENHEALKQFTTEFTGIKIRDSEKFSTPVIHPGEVTYSGYFRNFTNRLGTNTGIVSVMNAISRETEKYVIPIRDDGFFTVTFPLHLPQIVQVGLPKLTVHLFLEPGKNLFHLANSGIPEQRSLFMGESAVLNYDWEKLPALETFSPAFYEAVANMSFSEYAGFIQSKKEKADDELAAIQNLSEKARIVGEMNIKFQFADALLRFNQNRRMGIYYMNRILKQEEQIAVAEEKVNTAELKEWIKNTPVNDETALLCNKYGQLLNAIRLIDFELGNLAYYHKMTEVKDDLVKNGQTLSAEETEMFEFIRLNFVENSNDTEARNFSRMYMTPWNEFRKKHNETIQNHMEDYYVANLAKNVNDIFGISNGMVMEYPQAQNYLAALKNVERPDVNEFNAIKSKISHPELKEYVISEYYKKKAETEVLSAGGETMLKTEGDKIFHNIIKNYKGKVVYVDFWATWCGPCKSGIEQVKPLKEELKNENIVFVYITNPTSPEKDYAKAKPDIMGEHYKLTSDEWNHLAAKFNIYGIPHYALVDKNGRVANAHLPHFNNDELKKVLLEQANK
jgi:thiol-disulfide isomerase/thioredoxin